MRADLIASAMAGSIYFERLQVFVGLVNDLSCMQMAMWVGLFHMWGCVQVVLEWCFQLSRACNKSNTSTNPCISEV